ncbi:outer membrane phosphoporin protein E, partial [Haemophilus influenzae]
KNKASTERCFLLPKSDTTF